MSEETTETEVNPAGNRATETDADDDTGAFTDTAPVEDAPIEVTLAGACLILASGQVVPYAPGKKIAGECMARGEFPIGMRIEMEYKELERYKRFRDFMSRVKVGYIGEITQSKKNPKENAKVFETSTKKNFDKLMAQID